MGKDHRVHLSETFVAHLDRAAERVAVSPELESALARLLADAHAAWPAISLPDDVFVQHVAERLPADVDPRVTLTVVHAADLYLALACSRGDPSALQMFETRFMADLSTYLARRDALPAFTDEVKQALRARLLVGAAGVLPRIASYGGQGPLVAWLRIAAVRLAANIRRQEAQHHGQAANPNTHQDAWSLFRSPIADPELAFLKAKYSSDLEASFRATLVSLGRRERTILRLHYLEGLTMASIAILYEVSARTIERWLAGARSQILKRTRQFLSERLQIDPSQLDTLVGLVQSQLDPSLISLLEPPDRG